MSVAILPNVGRLLVKPDPPPDAIAGIFRPGTSYERSQSGEVLTLPPEHTEDYQVGDRVLFSPMAGHEFKVEGETFFLLEPSEVLGWMNASPD